MSESRGKRAEPLVEKSNGRIDLTIPDDVRDELNGLAFLDGKPLTSYCRDVLIRHVRGHIGLLKLRGVIRQPTSSSDESER